MRCDAMVCDGMRWYAMVCCGQAWRERLGMARDPAWDEVKANLAPLPTATRGALRAKSSATSSPVMRRASGSQTTASMGARLESPVRSLTAVVTPSTCSTRAAMEARMSSQVCHSASWSRLVQASTAASIPMISSLPILLSRPGPWCGEEACQAALSSVLSPRTTPAHWGPHRALPPL